MEQLDLNRKNSESSVLYKRGSLAFKRFSANTTLPCHNLKSFKLIKKLSPFIKKETLASVFSCEFCEISENCFFT